MLHGTKNMHSDYALLNIRHKLTLIQQKSWHYMLIFATKDMLFKDEHKISLARLVNYLNVKSSYEIKDKILDMGKSDDCEIFSYYFKKIKIVEDTVFYSYPEHLKILLSRQSVVDVSRKIVDVCFHSKYSLFLYEFILFYTLFDAKHTVSLREFRNYLGLESYQYADVKGFHKIIVAQALCEINTQTSCFVSLKYEKEGSVVVAINVSIKEKSCLFEKMCDKEKNELFLSNAAYARYLRLSQQARNRVDLLYGQWVQGNIGEVVLDQVLKQRFLVEQFVAPYEHNIDLLDMGDTEMTPVS